MATTIHIDPSIKAFIDKHGEETFPYECCGFLYGSDANGRNITVAKRVTNSKYGDQRRRFEITPQDYLEAERYAAMNDLDLLGIYHSHPNHPAIASVHDLAKAMPFFSYVIVSIMEGKAVDLKSWKLKDEERVFEEETVLISQLSTI
ncbi:MAG: M67 family metallopeptidase [Saprospiraceae bacterium]|nr:M67 family metallopeptidase [Saprospiraceae bacterium]